MADIVCEGVIVLTARDAAALASLQAARATAAARAEAAAAAARAAMLAADVAWRDGLEALRVGYPGWRADIVYDLEPGTCRLVARPSTAADGG